MPPRKEPKETVTYPPSKRKPPPFKPQRPSQVPRVASTSTDTTSGPASRTPSANIPATGRASVPAAKKSGSDFASARTGIAAGTSNAGTSNAGAKRKARVIDSDEDEDGIEDESSRRTDNTNKEAADDSEEDLADDPLTARLRQPPQPTAPAKRRPGRPPNRKEPSPLSISEDEMDTYMGSVNDVVAPRVPSQSGDVPSIPRPLLLRLLHENFASKDTKIDKHALAVLEKYFEIYIRETIARSSLAKKEDVENGVASQSEERWLEKSDLEKVVAGIVMDF